MNPCATRCKCLRIGDLLLPFTVTKPVTNREMSIAVESRDVNLVFGEDLIGSSYEVSIHVP